MLLANLTLLDDNINVYLIKDSDILLFDSHKVAYFEEEMGTIIKIIKLEGLLTNN